MPATESVDPRDGLAELPEVLSIDQLATVLGQSRTTLYDWIERGDFPPILLPRLGRRHRISKRLLTAYLEGRLDDDGRIVA